MAIEVESRLFQRNIFYVKFLFTQKSKGINIDVEPFGKKEGIFLAVFYIEIFEKEFIEELYVDIADFDFGIELVGKVE